MIKAVFFDIGGTVHTQDATPESDRDYKERLWRYLEEHGIRTADTPDELLEHINKGAKAYKAYTEEELIEIPADRIWQEFFLADFHIPAEKARRTRRRPLLYVRPLAQAHRKARGLEETLKGLKDAGYRLGVISNIMSTTFVPRILEEHGVRQYFRNP